jgi:hypothetical protein
MPLRRDELSGSEISIDIPFHKRVVWVVMGDDVERHLEV